MLKVLKESLRPWYYLATSKIHREFYHLFSSYASAPRYRKTDVRFLKYKFTVPDTLSFLHQYREIFVEETYKFESSRPNPVVYDCGANVGLSCLYFKVLFPQARITGFEADPEIFKVLKSNLDQNLSPGAVQLRNSAVWINNDGVEFAVEGSDGGTVLSSAAGKRVKIDSVRLRDLLKAQRIDLLKLDIEGAEAEVLQDCDGHLDTVDRIFFEYHSMTAQPQRLNMLLDIMSRNGFRYFIQSPYLQQAPFVRKPADKEVFDLQLNIYCYRP